MILVTFAVPFESAAFRAKIRGRSEIECLHTGMGHASAARAVRSALEKRAYTRIIISGFAGGLSASLQVGNLVSDTADPPIVGRTMVEPIKLSQSEDVLIDAEAKRRFRSETGADAVDMESTTIRAICAELGVPCRVLRAISDDATGSLVLPTAVLSEVTRRPIRGVARLAAFLVTRPRTWKPFSKMIRNCQTAQKRLAVGLIDEVGINHSGQQR